LEPSHSTGWFKPFYTCSFGMIYIESIHFPFCLYVQNHNELVRKIILQACHIVFNKTRVLLQSVAYRTKLGAMTQSEGVNKQSARRICYIYMALGMEHQLISTGF
jgi:hypothetical protein